MQLHGNEDDCYIEEIRKNLPDTPLIKAVRVQSKEQILEAEKLDVDYLLLDTYEKGQYFQMQSVCGGCEQRSRNGWREG